MFRKVHPTPTTGCVSLPMIHHPTAAVALLFTCALCCLSPGARASTSLVHINEDTVFSPPLKLLVTKPDGWIFSSNKEMSRAQQSGDQRKNTILKYLSYQSRNDPFVVMSRAGLDDHDALISMIQYPNAKHGITDGTMVAERVLDHCMKVLTGATIVEAPVAIKVGTTDFVHCTLRS